MNTMEGLSLRVRPAFDLAVRGVPAACQQTLPAKAKDLDAYKPQIPRVSNMAGLGAAAQSLYHTGSAVK